MSHPFRSDEDALLARRDILRRKLREMVHERERVAWELGWVVVELDRLRGIVRPAPHRACVRHILPPILAALLLSAIGLVWLTSTTPATIAGGEPAPHSPAGDVRVAVSVTPNFASRCPSRFDFDGVIVTTRDSTVSYRWERSDGALAPVTTVRAEAGERVMAWTWWALGPQRNFAAWARLHVLYPEDRLSEPARFRLDCPTGR